MVERNYEAILKELNRLLKATRSAQPPPLALRMHIERKYLQVFGIDMAEVNKLNIVHVAGSKGKGSICAYIESILRHEGYRTGLLTSPHLINVEERIRVNGEPIDREVFAEHFWLLHDRIKSNAEVIAAFPQPTYFSFLLHLAFGVFISQRVDVAVVEVGLGGRYDNSNVVSRPRVTVVSAIELEHTNIFGNTIREVAWNKAGIFKPGVPAVVATDEPEDALTVFVEEAHSVQCPLVVAPRFVDIRRTLVDGNVVLEGWDRFTNRVGNQPVCERNICLALAAVHLWHRCENHLSTGGSLPLLDLDTKVIPTLHLRPTEKQLTGILSTRIVGRFHEVKISGNLTFFLDCAHTITSIEHCCKWFQSVSPASSSAAMHRTFRLLLFVVTGNRDPVPMLQQLLTLNFDAVYFGALINGPLVEARTLIEYPPACEWKAVWTKLKSSTPYYILEEADFVRFLNALKTWDGSSPVVFNSVTIQATKIHVLVTGSVYLVGDVFSVLQPEYSPTWK